MKKRCALILTTGDRIDYLDASVRSCLGLIERYDPEIETDIYLISYRDLEIEDDSIKRIFIERHDLESDLVKRFPLTMQLQQNHANDIETIKRVNLGHLILFGLIPDAIFRNRSIFEEYDFILKSRSDLVFGLEEFSFDHSREVLTFECFWGGCRYNQHFTNDQIVFGESKDVLEIASYPIGQCSIISSFWNPEHYMTYLFSKSSKSKKEMSTDRYYLLSKDRKCRKWIGFPLENITDRDISFLDSMGIDFGKLEFENGIG